MISKITTKYKTNGMMGLLLPSITCIPGIRALCMYYLYRMPITGIHHKRLSMNSIRLEVAREDSMEDIVKIQNKPEIFTKRFCMNHICLLAYADNNAVAYLWGQQGGVHVEQCYGFEVPINNNQVFYYDSYTLPEWRKKGLLRCLLKEMAWYCEINLHKNELVAIIEASNMVSQKAHEKIGFFKDRLVIYADYMGVSMQLKLFSYKEPEH